MWVEDWIKRPLRPSRPCDCEITDPHYHQAASFFQSHPLEKLIILFMSEPYSDWLISLSVEISNVFIQLWSKECKLVHNIMKYSRSWACSSPRHSFLSSDVIPLVKPFLTTQVSPSGPSPTTLVHIFFISLTENFFFLFSFFYSVVLNLPSYSNVCSVRSEPMCIKRPYSCILAIPISFFKKTHLPVW